MGKYIRRRKQILDQMCIWEQLSNEERELLQTARTEIEADNIVRTFRRKYL